MGQKALNTPSKKQYSMGFELEMFIKLEEYYPDSDVDDIGEDEFYNDMEEEFQKILPNCQATNDQSLEYGDDIDDRGVEIISPPYSSVEEGLDHLKKAFDYMDSDFIYTTDQCGLHVTFGKWTHDEYLNIDWLKFFLVLHGEQTLEDFDRQFNEFATLEQIYDTINGQMNKDNYDSKNYQQIIHKVNAALLLWADKMDVVNLKKLSDSGLLEFRAMGNENYQYAFTTVKKNILRFQRALEIASDPNAYRKEYLTKISKYINKNNDNNNSEEKMGYYIRKTILSDFQYDPALFTSKIIQEKFLYLILDTLFERIYNINLDDLKSIETKLTIDKLKFIRDYIGKTPIAKSQIRSFKNEFDGISTIEGLNINDYKHISMLLKLCFK